MDHRNKRILRRKDTVRRTITKQNISYNDRDVSYDIAGTIKDTINGAHTFEGIVET